MPGGGGYDMMNKACLLYKTGVLCSSKERTVEKSSFAKVSPSREISVSVAVYLVDVCLGSGDALVAGVAINVGSEWSFSVPWPFGSATTIRRQVRRNKYI